MQRHPSRHMAFFCLLVLFAVFSHATAENLTIEDHENSEGAADRILSLLSPLQCQEPFESFVGLCLKWIPLYRNWSVAEENCTAMGGHLVWINNAEEYELIRKFVAKTFHGFFWIGLHRVNGSFKWSSRNTGRRRIRERKDHLWRFIQVTEDLLVYKDHTTLLLSAAWRQTMQFSTISSFCFSRWTNN